MSIESRREESERATLARAVPVKRVASGRWASLTFAVVIAGLALTRANAGWSSAPFSERVELWTMSVVVLLSLAALGTAIWKMMESAQSDLRHVFCSRYVFAFGLLFLVASGALAASMMVGDPFHELSSRGQITTDAISATGCVLGIVACSVGAVVALLNAWEAYRDERHWGESLGIGR